MFADQDVAKRINIELGEQHLLHYRDQLKPTLEVLADIGVGILIDNFGRNFSLFSKVRELPVTGIKIDGLFTQNIAWDPIDRKLVHSMVEVAQAGGVHTTAKSVETIEALTNLQQDGVHYAQGHLLCYPSDNLPNSSVHLHSNRLYQKPA